MVWQDRMAEVPLRSESSKSRTLIRNDITVIIEGATVNCRLALAKKNIDEGKKSWKAA